MWLLRFQVCETNVVYKTFNLNCFHTDILTVRLTSPCCCQKIPLLFLFANFLRFQRYTPQFPMEACKHYPVAPREHLNEMFQGQETSENRTLEERNHICNSGMMNEWNTYLLTNDRQSLKRVVWQIMHSTLTLITLICSIFVHFCTKVWKYIKHIHVIYHFNSLCLSVFCIDIFSYFRLSVVGQLLIGNWIKKCDSAWIQFYSYISLLR